MNYIYINGNNLIKSFALTGYNCIHKNTIPFMSDHSF